MQLQDEVHSCLHLLLVSAGLMHCRSYLLVYCCSWMVLSVRLLAAAAAV
jgi:hypothetical protein